MADYTPYIAAQVNLADHTLTYNLYTLLQALDASAVPATVTPYTCAELSVQSSNANTATKLIFIGDQSIDTANPPTRYGVELLPGGIYQRRRVSSNISLSAITLRTDTDNLKVNILLAE